MARKKHVTALVLPDLEKDRPGSWEYASGSVWCLEKDLMGRAGLDRLYAAQSADEVRRLLMEYRYPQKESVEAMIEAEKLRLYAFFEDVAPEETYVQALLMRHDAHNLKLALGYALTGESPDRDSFDGELLKPSLIDGDLLWCAVIRGEKDRILPGWADRILATAKEAYLAGYDLASADRAIDRSVHEVIQHVTGTIRDPWLGGYFSLYRDLTNLETLLRAKARSMEESVYADNLLPDGRLDRQDWLSYYRSDTRQIIDDLCDTPYQVLSSHFATYGEPGGRSAFSLDRDRMLAAYLSEGKTRLAGPPRVVAYLMARELEFKNIRIVMSTLADGRTGEDAAAFRRDFGK